jgi:hypothetical protein
MKEPYNEGLATYVDPEPCGGAREGVFEALDRGMCRQTIEPRNLRFLGCRRCFRMRKAIPVISHWREVPGPHAVEELLHAQNYLAREPGDPVPARQHGATGRVGKPKGVIRR